MMMPSAHSLRTARRRRARSPTPQRRRTPLRAPLMPRPPEGIRKTKRCGGRGSDLVVSIRTPMGVLILDAKMLRATTGIPPSWKTVTTRGEFPPRHSDRWPRRDRLMALPGVVMRAPPRPGRTIVPPSRPDRHRRDRPTLPLGETLWRERGRGRVALRGDLGSTPSPRAAGCHSVRQQDGPTRCVDRATSE